jgi:hypothetical protein
MTNGRKTKMMRSATTHDLHPIPASRKEAPTMLDRERLLARDHETRLHAEANARRMATEATKHGARGEHASLASIRLTIGRWLISTGDRLDAAPDPCGPAEARPV